MRFSVDPMRAIAALVLVCCACFARAQSSPGDLILECSREADRSSIGLQALEVECPGLEHAVVELGFAPFLAEEQAGRLTIHALDDIVALSRQFGSAPAPAEELDIDGLHDILTQMERERAERPQSWVERLREWMRGLTQRAEGEESWLGRWFRDLDISTGLTRGLAYALVAVVIVLALGVLFNELRAAGVLQRGRRRSKRGALAEAAQASAEPKLEDLLAAPLEERPSILFRLLISALRRAGRLEADRSLTHRELTARASFEETRQRDSFRQVAMLAERTLYGGARIPSDELDRVMREGAALHAELTVGAGMRQ